MEGTKFSDAGEGVRLGRDPHTIAPLTGQRKSAAAALPYYKLALIGSTGLVPRTLGDATGAWLIQLAVTTDVGDTLRQYRRRSPYGMDVHFEAWTDAPRDVGQMLKARFDAALADAGRQVIEAAALFDCEPERALHGLVTLCKDMGVTLYDNAWYDAQVSARVAANARALAAYGGRR